MSGSLCGACSGSQGEHGHGCRVAAEEAHLDRLRRAALENGYRFEGDGDAVRCLPIAIQTAAQAERAMGRAAEKRKRVAAKRVAEAKRKAAR
jgi:hypothetical protein